MQTSILRTLLFVGLAATFVACGASDRPRKDETISNCGNGSIDTGEVCDGTDNGGQTCVSRGFASGTLTCLADCSAFDESACVADQNCGNGRIESGESCDPLGPNLDGETCETRGFAGGSLACATNCTFDTSGCSSQQVECGNGRQEGNEQCDGSDLAGATCQQQTGRTGTLACDGSCAFDTSGCTGTTAAECGNDLIDGTDVCDGTDLGGLGCTNLGYDGGTLACHGDCSGFDTALCTGTPPSCAGPDGYRDGGLNTALGDGEPCNFDSDCASQECNSSYYCGATGTPPTIHAGDLPLGAACDASASCLSGYCWGGGDSWICAETCSTPITATAAGLACQADTGSSTGAACVPGPGAGAIGDACISGSFDCAERSCFNEDFCTSYCDPTDPSGCPTGNTCALLAAGTIYGDLYLCVPDTAIGVTPTDGACEAPWDCSDPDLCVEGSCRTPCPNGDECNTTTHFCAGDHPAGALCLPTTARGGVGDACEYDYECETDLLCFDEGTGGTCHATCPNGPSDCTGGTTCVAAPIGPSLDTVIDVFDDAAATQPVVNDDDGGSSLFSLAEVPVTADPQSFWIQVARYPNSAQGPYSLAVSLPAVPATNPVAEVEPNDALASPQTIAVGDLIAAESLDIVDPDVDVFLVTVNGAVGETLTAETNRSTTGICTTAPTLAADGEPCSSDATCQNDCFPFMRVGTSFCAAGCQDSGDCGGGSCEQFADATPTEGYCFPAGAVVAGTGAFGDPCAGPHDCASRHCVQHKYDTAWRCGDTCTGADTSCASDGMCNAADPIYGNACTPTLGGSVLPGGSCLWDADCETGNVCVGEVCQPQLALSRYDVDPDVVTGLPCNIDDDCVGGSCAVLPDGYFCADTTITGCDSNGVTGTIDAGELCDGSDVGSLACSDLGLGGGILGCNADCDAYDTSGCDGLVPGQPCNANADCLAGDVCFRGGNTWFCAQSCTGASDPSCTGTLFAGALDLGCQAQSDGSFLCLPTAGTSVPNDPCRSGYLDCDSGLCWGGSVCRERCDLNTPACERDTSCVSYELPTGFAGQTDTMISVVDGSDANLAGPVDDGLDPAGDLVSFYSPVAYTAPSGGFVFVKVESSDWYAGNGQPPASGDYQLQVFSDALPPPFGAAILESELRSTPTPNGDLASFEFQDLDAAGLPERVAANLAAGTLTDVDYYRVFLAAGETLSAQTTYPLTQICWPDDDRARDLGEACDYDFQCQSGSCLGVCLAECTDGTTCTSGSFCNSFFADLRSYCFPALKFADACDAAAVGPGGDVPSCPNSYCLRHPFDASGDFWCSGDCLTQALGTGCGQYDAVGGSFNGECTGLSTGELVCARHLARSVATGGACLLNADCTSVCCDATANTCNATASNCIQ